MQVKIIVTIEGNGKDLKIGLGGQCDGTPDEKDGVPSAWSLEEGGREER